jgi:hypothetical protein
MFGTGEKYNLGKAGFKMAGAIMWSHPTSKKAYYHRAGSLKHRSLKMLENGYLKNMGFL